MRISTTALFFVLLLPGMVFGKERFPGTRVFLEAPEGFVKDVTIPGYLMAAAGSKISVMVLDGAPFSKIKPLLGKESMAAKGMKVLETEEQKMGSCEGKLLYLSQVMSGLEYRRRMLVFGNDSEVYMITAFYPKAQEERLGGKLKQCLMGCEWKEEMELSLLDGMPFSVSEGERLKFVSRVGNNLMMGEKEDAPAKGGGATMILSVSLNLPGWQVPADKAAFCRQMLSTNPYLGNVAVADSFPIKVDGLEGWSIVVSAKDNKSGQALYVEQSVLFHEKGFYNVHASVRADQREKYQPEFQKILKSLKRG